MGEGNTESTPPTQTDTNTRLLDRRFPCNLYTVADPRGSRGFTPPPPRFFLLVSENSRELGPSPPRRIPAQNPPTPPVEEFVDPTPVYRSETYSKTAIVLSNSCFRFYSWTTYIWEADRFDVFGLAEVLWT